MFKSVTALSAALIVGLALVGSATDASAGYRHHHHGCCGPIAPSYTYSTKKVYKNVTHYRDVHRTKYVKRIKRIIHVTRIQPIIHIHNVTRVHTRIVGVVHRVHQREVQYLPAKRYVTSSVVHLRPHCACPPCRRY
jgi:hypothetical protein